MSAYFPELKAQKQLMTNVIKEEEKEIVLFTWEHGFEIEVEVGASLCGLKHKHKRPDEVELSFEEIEEMTRDFPGYLESSILPALSDNGS